MSTKTTETKIGEIRQIATLLNGMQNIKVEIDQHSTYVAKASVNGAWCKPMNLDDLKSLLLCFATPELRRWITCHVNP